MQTKSIGIYVYDNAEVLDFSGPFEVFTTATRVANIDGMTNAPFNTCLISEHGNIVTARAGYQVVSQYSIDDHPPLDVLIVVGGVHDDEMNKPNVINWIAKQNELVGLIASVCTGAFLLAQAKIITNHNVTTHWDDQADLKVKFPRLSVQENIRWVDEGKIITSGGISAGIDMSLYLVSRLERLALANKTARQMEFSWSKQK